MKISHRHGIFTVAGSCPEGKIHRLVFGDRHDRITSIKVDGVRQALSGLHPAVYIIYNNLGR